MTVEEESEGKLRRSLNDGRSWLRRLLRPIWRRKRTVIGTVVVCTAVAWAALAYVPPQYTSTAKVVIDSRQNRGSPGDARSGAGTSDGTLVETEAQVITSRALAEKAVARLNLDHVREFSEIRRHDNTVWAWLNPFNYLPPQWFGQLDAWGWTQPPARGIAPPDTVEARQQMARVVDALLDRVEVRPVGRSRVIEIAATSTDARLAAEIANTVADLYLVDKLEARFEATKRTTGWLNERVAQLRLKIQAGDQTVQGFRNAAGLLGKDTIGEAAKRVAEVNSQLIAARSRAEIARQRATSLENDVSGSDGEDAPSMTAALSSPFLQRLRRQQVEIRARAAALAKVYGPLHPRMLALREELEATQAELAGEAKKVSATLRNEAKAAAGRADSLSGQLNQASDELDRLNKSDVEARALEREADANRTLLQSLLGRLTETTSREGVYQPDARLISAADVSIAPSFPDKQRFLLYVAMAAALFGVTLVFVVDGLDDSFRSADEIEAVTGQSALGLVPRISKVRRGSRSPERYILDRPASSFAEALRSIHTGLLLSAGDRHPKTVMITSALPREGKSTIAVSLARLLSISGQRTLLIDCDLRRPRLHRVFQMQRSPGLAEVHAGDISLDSVIQKDQASGMDVITAGEPVMSPPDLLGSEQFASILKIAALDYDIVIIDSSPVLAVSDARVLARVADATVFVVRWGSTRREAATMALGQIIKAGGRVAGLVLSLVDVRRHARYDYSDSGAYYGNIKKYYID